MKRYSLIVLCSILFSCNSEKKEIIKNGATGGVFGTSYSIIYLADKTLDYQQEIDSVFQVVNTSLSTYIPDSDISKINRGDSTLQVDHMFQDVFDLSKEIHRVTKGYFDPTVGVLVNAWGFGPEQQMLLDSISVDSLLQFVGFDKVQISQEHKVLKENSNIYFDFNAIAKGYAIDRVAVLLDEKGIQNYLIEIGGEVVGKGINTIKSRPWGVGIDNPENEYNRQSKIAIRLNNRALASSGNYRKFRIDEVTGQKYVHTIDPITGFTKNSNTLGVTILADDCATADGYATACMVMDLEQAKQLVLSDDSLDAYIIYADDKGSIQEFLTEGFKNLILE
ncbi:FAD:protein FMN transferase [Maribacter antarcticus]|uniref:FAD:protein FMN transferase n=1 Tax=Maribacter antarcticus TaxID=505250 RepID=UPI000562219B|nr:FAD:protein FMN transferase [Maribacter antarcticus]